MTFLIENRFESGHFITLKNSLNRFKKIEKKFKIKNRLRTSFWVL